MVYNSFSLNQLEKYGWKKGDGLGATGSGIKDAIKPKLKFDSHGLGHNIADELCDTWWRNSYDNALESIDITEKNDHVKMAFKDNKPIKTPSLYANFVKTATLENDGIEQLNDGVADQSRKQENVLPTISDDELFKMCSGRTAHKGARHGLGASGKLARLEMQENNLKVIGSGLNEEVVSRIKKRKKRKSIVLENDIPLNIDSKIPKLYKDKPVDELEKTLPEFSTVDINVKKAKKKKHKRQSSCADKSVQDSVEVIPVQSITGTVDFKEENTLLSNELIQKKKKSKKLKKTKEQKENNK